jgi:hypothetical protein
MRVIKLATAYTLTAFMTDTDHVTGKTGLTLTITASKAGAAFASITPTVTELANGWYTLSLTASHTDTLGDLALHITASGADATDLLLQVRANVLGDTLPANVTTWLGAVPNALQGGRVDSYLGAAAAGVIAAASFAANALDAVWSSATRLLTAGTNIVLAKGVGVTGFNDLSAAAVNAEADTALADVGLTGTITGRIDAAISSRSSHTAADVAAGVTSDHGAGSYVRNTEPASAATIASQVRTELTTELARVDAAISSRLAAGTYTAPDNASITAIKAKTDNLPSDPADASDIAIATNLLASGISAVKAKTDALPAAPAATGDIPSALTIASAVRTELATELARIDVALSTLSTYDGSDPTGVVTLLDRLSDARATLLDNLANLDMAISGLTLSSTERHAIADAYLDRADGIEPGMTPREAQRLMAAAVLGVASGMDAEPPAPVFRDTNDTKDRITAVCDAFGNRLAVTLDAS